MACVFGTFKESINSFELLDPADYLSTLGCSWDTM